VRSIAKRLISKELGKHFSWFGQKGNRNLSVTNVGKAIMSKFSFTTILKVVTQFEYSLLLGAGKCENPAISERDVIDVMIDFLRHCKDKPRSVMQQ